MDNESIRFDNPNERLVEHTSDEETSNNHDVNRSAKPVYECGDPPPPPPPRYRHIILGGQTRVKLPGRVM